MEALSLFEKIILFVVGGYIVLMVVFSFVGDFMENWWHWLIDLGGLFAIVGVVLLVS